MSERTKCPNCYGFGCNPVMDLPNKEENHLRICAKYFNTTYQCGDTCHALCPVCGGKGHLDWIDYLFKVPDDNSFKEVFEYIKDKQNYIWYTGYSSTAMDKIIDKIDINKFYKDIYGK